MTLYPYPGITPTVITVHDQIAGLQSQYMEKILLFSTIYFVYVIWNMFCDRPVIKDKTNKIQVVSHYFDIVSLVGALFLLVIAIIYYTGAF